jgi:molybdopterin molybdotransferase
MALSIEEALQSIYTHTQPTTHKLLSLESAHGFILAQDVVATYNLPPYDNSAMDGYALRMSESTIALKEIGTIFAGDDYSTPLREGETLRIMTGAKVPEGADVIVPIENTSKDSDGNIIVPTELKKQQHIRFMGEDIKAGEKLLHKGEKLNAYKIALLASQGISYVKVFKKPRIALFGSGNELKMHFEEIEGTQLYNTNSPTLLARAKELGCEVEFIGTAKDSLEDISEHIKSALDCDLIITSGGVSVGDADFTKSAFEPFGYEIYFDKIDIKPGKPTTFAHIGNTLVLNLPGNPLAASLNFELFGRAIINALSATEEKFIAPIVVKLKEDFVANTRRRSLVPGYFDGEFFTPAKKFAPGMVSPLAHANGFIVFESGLKTLKAQTQLRFISTEYTLNSKEPRDIFSS